MSIIVKLGGFVSGMTKEQVVERARKIIHFYKKIEHKIKAFVWDGDPFKRRGSNLDEERGTQFCFTYVLILIEQAFPEIPFVAAKREDQLRKLSEEYTETTKHGSVEIGCEHVFGPILVVAKTQDTSMMALSDVSLNVVTAPADTNWKDLGCLHIQFWKANGYQVHYVTIGGGQIVATEIERVGGMIDTVWRIGTSRLSPKEGSPPDVVPFFFSTNDESLLHQSLDALDED